jgi:uncharacterized protein (DUF2132 family)
MIMSEEIKNSNNPFHGVKLQDILESLVEHYGFKELGRKIEIRCFLHNSTITSCLKFLRKTPWARAKVEELYLNMVNKKS